MNTIEYTSKLLTEGKAVAQGDIRLEPWTGPVPSSTNRLQPEDGLLIVGHSETGHHHALALSDDVEVYDQDEYVSYITNKSDNIIELKHYRAFDTHAPHGIPPKSTVRVIRGREEHVKDQFRRALD